MHMLTSMLTVPVAGKLFWSGVVLYRCSSASLAAQTPFVSSETVEFAAEWSPMKVASRLHLLIHAVEKWHNAMTIIMYMYMYVQMYNALCCSASVHKINNVQRRIYHNYPKNSTNQFLTFKFFVEI